MRCGLPLVGKGKVWRVLLAAFLLNLGACGPGEELLPVRGRLTELESEGAPPGYVGRLPGNIDGAIPPGFVGQANPFMPEDQRALTAGGRVYTAGAGELSCAVCHGDTGRGYGPKAFFLDPRPADFASSPLQTAFREHQDYVLWWVSDGVPQTAMPAFRNVLTETERWQAITYAWYLGILAQEPTYEPHDRRGQGLPHLPMAPP